MGGLTRRILCTFVLGFYVCTDYSYGLQNVTLEITPHTVQRGKNVSLKCQYSLGDSNLYTVKWYRGQYEFFRYSPNDSPKMKTFYFPAAKIDISQSNANQVVLSEVGFNLSGNITCEVTSEGPGFSTASAVKELTVAASPKSAPAINTDRARYNPGDRLIANCSSPPSRPQTVLHFSINNKKISPLRHEVNPGPESLYWSFLHVDLILNSNHFDTKSQRLILTCAAVIDELEYKNSTTKTFPYRKDPVPEKVTSSSMTTNGICKGFLPISTMTFLLVQPFLLSYKFNLFFIG